MTRIDAYATPTIDIDHSCHIKAIELILPIIWSLYHATSHPQQNQGNITECNGGHYK